MAITRHIAKFLLNEHKHRPISGSLLLLSRQTVFLKPDDAIRLVTDHGLPIRAAARIETDTSTYRGRKEGYIADDSFFSLFSDATVQALDFKARKAGDIVHDLCTPVPIDLEGRFDFVYNGSVLDNVFDPATALENVTRLLSPNGVSLHYEGHRHFGYAYLYFSPGWFFDFAVVNGFADCKVFECLHDDIHTSNWNILLWSPFHKTDSGWQLTPPLRHAKDSVLVAIMQRQPGTAIGRRPIQEVYRTDQKPYFDAFVRFANEGRIYQGARVDGAPGYLSLGDY